MRAITGAITSTQPLPLRIAGAVLTRFSQTAADHLPTSDCATYVGVARAAAADHHRFLRELVGGVPRDEYEALVEGARGGGLDVVPAGGPRRESVEEAEVAVPADEKRSRKRKKAEEPREDKAVAGVASHVPALPEVLSEPRKKKDKHSSKELQSVVKQEPDLVVEEDGGSGRKKKKKEKRSDMEVTSIVKQEPGLVVEEADPAREKKKDKKKKEMEVNGKIVDNGVAEQGAADGDKKRKKKHHSNEEGEPKGVKEENMAVDSDLNSEKKKKKKRDRGEDHDDAQEQGEHKKKKRRKES